MEVPGFQDITLPLLKFAADGKEHTTPEAIEAIAKAMNITEAQRRELLPSGRQTRFENRVRWAKKYLREADLLESPRRAYFKITKHGLEVLKNPPKRIDIKFMMKYPKFVDFRKRSKAKKPQKHQVHDESLTPEESVEEAHQKLRDELEQELLTHISKCSDSFFETLVVDLLLKMGYGGSRKDAGKAIGKSGDGGIDGIIKEDKLGLDAIYIQAKKWSNPVGRPEIQKFVGALKGRRAQKGIFITTSRFSSGARQYVKNIDLRVILINGEELAQLMMDHDVGVTTRSVFPMKNIDSDYFEE